MWWVERDLHITAKSSENTKESPKSFDFRLSKLVEISGIEPLTS